jgi:WD40 repeat protein
MVNSPGDQPNPPVPSPAEPTSVFDGKIIRDQDADLGFLQPPGRPAALGSLGHYEVLDVLGRGGFGIVFRAFDKVLERIVAIKVLAPEMAATSPARKRFLREARAAAQVRHENVVQIHAVEEQPLPYLVMEFVPGETLQKRLDRTGPLEAAEVVAIGRQVAEGLAAAHAAGLIHRDVKPANVLVEAGARPRVKITDFGLARAADDASLTQSGMVAGTPLYMSPEQARGDTLDHRTDLFSLGSVLYAVAAGRPPFRAESPLAVLKRVVEEEPRPIPEVIPETPAWLCRVIAQLMAKDPAERFQTAAEVAAALEAGPTGPEAHARPASRPAARPRKLLLAGGALALVAGLAVLAYVLTRPGPAPQGAPDSSGKDRDGSAGVVVLPLVPVPTPEQLAARPAAADALRREDIPPAVLAAAGRGDPADAPKELVAVLGGPSFRHQRYPVVIRPSPDGTLLVTREDLQSALVVWDAATGQGRFSLNASGGNKGEFAFSPDGKFLAAPHDRDAIIWDLEKRQVVHTFKGHTDYLRCVNFSPKVDRLLTSGHKEDRTVRVWDIAQEKELCCFREHTAEVPYAEFSPDGTRIVSAGCDGSARVWEADTGKQLVVFRGGPDGFSMPFVNHARFSKDGRRVVSIAYGDGRVFVWDAETGDLIRLLKTDDDLVFDVAFSPDGTRVATCGQHKEGKSSQPSVVRLWNAETGEVALALNHPAAVFTLVFSPDGKRLFTACEDTRIRIWDTETGEELTPAGQGGKLLAVAVSPDGKTVASAGADTRIRLWDLATGQLARTLPGRTQPHVTLTFSPDGKTLASGSENNGEITFWDWQGGKETGALTGQGRKVPQLAYSPDGRFLALRTAFGETKLYDIATKKLRTIDPGGFEGDGCVAFSPDGKVLASGGSDRILHLWDVDTGKELAALTGHGDMIRWAGFRPNGQSVAFGGGSQDRLIRHWGLAPQAPLSALRGHTGGVTACAWRADGKLLASASGEDGTVRLWDPDGNPPSSQAIVLFLPRQGVIQDIALSPEGRHLLLANSDGTIWVLRLAKVGEVFRAP